MKALIILSNSWSPFFVHSYLYGENELLWGTACSFGVFSPEKTPSFSRELICNKILLQNYPGAMQYNEHGQSDVERQISIQGIHLSAFWKYIWKIKEVLRIRFRILLFDIEF